MVTSVELRQGDIIKVEKIRYPVLIVSKDFFNQSGEIIGCPIYETSTNSPLHIEICAGGIHGYVQCEKLALLDLAIRGYGKVETVLMKDMMNILDAIQSVFDYI